MPNYVMNRITINTDEETLVKMLKAFKNDEQLKENWPEDWETMSESELVTVHPTIDFNKVIPMPEPLNIESGSNTKNALDWWLWANRRELDARERFEPTLSDDDYVKVLDYPRYGSDFHEKMKTEEGIAEFEKYNRDIKIRELGMKAAHNIIDYDAPTWYDWRNKNWGTKWNSCEAVQSRGMCEIEFKTAWSPVYYIAEALSKQYPGAIISITGADEFAPAVFPTVMYVDGEEIIVNREEENEELWSDLWGCGDGDDDESEDGEDEEKSEGILALDRIEDLYTR